MDKVTQQNAANAEETSSASEQMKSQASQMKDVVDELLNLVGGRKAMADMSRKKTDEKKRDDRIDFDDSAVIRKPAAGYESKKQPDPAQLIPFDDDDFQEF
jgi:methyl-accepting chemotaxis protein